MLYPTARSSGREGAGARALDSECVAVYSFVPAFAKGTMGYKYLVISPVVLAHDHSGSSLTVSLSFRYQLASVLAGSNQFYWRKAKCE